jgi:hypothetical protein
MFKRVQSRDQLMDYALRQNGGGVIQVNVSQEQLEDCVNDALHMFFRYHMDATSRNVITVKVDQEAIDTQSVKVPYDVISVMDVVYTPSTTFSMANLQYQMYFSDLISKTFTGNGLSTYTITRSYLSMLSSLVGDIYHITDFSLHTNSVKIFFNWSKIKVGDYVGLEVQQIHDPELYHDVWDNYWLKKYTTALVKKMWGTNLMKYSGPSLVGGGQINGIEIYQAALEEVQKLEDRLYDEFQFPCMGFMA